MQLALAPPAPHLEAPIPLEMLAGPRPGGAVVARTARQLELSPAAVPAVVAQLDGESPYAVVNAFTLPARAFPVAERVRVETTMSRFLRAGPLDP